MTGPVDLADLHTLTCTVCDGPASIHEADRWADIHRLELDGDHGPFLCDACLYCTDCRGEGALPGSGDGCPGCQATGVGGAA